MQVTPRRKLVRENGHVVKAQLILLGPRSCLSRSAPPTMALYCVTETKKRERKRRARAAEEARARAAERRAEEERAAKIAAMRAFTIDLQVRALNPWAIVPSHRNGNPSLYANHTEQAPSTASTPHATVAYPGNIRSFKLKTSRDETRMNTSTC